MRIVLVRPNSYIVPTAPPMGLASLAAWLRLKRGDDTSIIDARKMRIPLAELADKIASSSPDVVGIGAISVEAAAAAELAAAVKRRLPSVPLIFGGPHASASPREIMEDRNVDFTVAGEGEESMRELLDRIESGDFARPVAGTWDRHNGEIRFGGVCNAIDVDTLPTPAWDLLPIKSYFKPGRNTHDTVAASVRCLPVMTSRGCPFKCIYCHGLFGHLFRPRSAANVLAEIHEIVETYRIEAIEIVDDIFNLDMDRAKEILRGLAPMRIAVSFPNGIRGDRVDEEMLDLMESANVSRVNFAVESASPRIQKLIRKGLDLDKVRRTIEAASKRRFMIGGYFMLGFPDETAAEMEETIRFASATNLHMASFFYLTAFPGTEAARIAKEKGSDLTRLPRDYSTLYANLTAEPDNVVRAMRKKAYRKFYGNPKRILRTFLAAPKTGQTLINAWKVLLLSLRDSVDY